MPAYLVVSILALMLVASGEQLEHHLELCLELSRKLGAEHYDEQMTRRFVGEPPARGDAW